MCDQVNEFPQCDTHHSMQSSKNVLPVIAAPAVIAAAAAQRAWSMPASAVLERVDGRTLLVFLDQVGRMPLAIPRVSRAKNDDNELIWCSVGYDGDFLPVVPMADPFLPASRALSCWS